MKNKNLRNGKKVSLGLATLMVSLAAGSLAFANESTVTPEIKTPEKVVIQKGKKAHGDKARKAAKKEATESKASPKVEAAPAAPAEGGVPVQTEGSQPK